MNKSIIAAISAVFFVGSIHAANQEGPEGGKGMGAPEIPAFEELDRDGNGFISRSEAGVLPCLRDNFGDIDKNSEEGLDRAEYVQATSRHC